MPAKACDMDSIRQAVVGKLLRYYGVTVESATRHQLYKATAITIRDQIMELWMESRKKTEAEQGKTPVLPLHRISDGADHEPEPDQHERADGVPKGAEGAGRGYPPP